MKSYFVVGSISFFLSSSYVFGWIDWTKLAELSGQDLLIFSLIDSWHDLTLDDTWTRKETTWFQNSSTDISTNNGNSINSEILTSLESSQEVVEEILPLITTWSIYISEIFARDTAFLGEYIIIESFIEYSGALEVVGLGQWNASKIINISISPWQKAIITDSPSKITNRSGLLLPISSITLTDDGEQLQIKLTWGIITDQVIFHSSSLDQSLFYTDSDSSGNRVFSTFWVPTPFTQTSLWTWQNETWTTTGDTTILTWQTFSGDNQNMTWIVCIESTTQWTVTISEIHPFDTELFPEYIELLVDWVYTSPITIVWLWQWQTSKTITLSVWDRRVILTNDKTFFPVSTKVIELPSISLTDSGEPLQIIWQSWQVLDSAVYTQWIQGKSLYLSWNSSEHIFSQSDFPSPGFDLSQVNHLLFDRNFTNFYSCSIDLQHTDPFYVGSKINIIASSNNKQIQNNNSEFSCERNLNETNYEFTWCNPTYFEFNTGGIFKIWLTLHDLTTQQICSTTLSLNYPPNPTAWQICKQTYYQELYLKRKSKFEYLKKWIGSLGFSVNTTGDVTEKWTATWQQLSIWTGKVHIVSILPNPAWKDDNQESITIKNTDTLPYDLTQFVLFNGKSKKKFPSDITQLKAGEQRTIIATLWLTNGPTCIKLQDTTTIFDTFCYPKAADGQVFTTSLDSLQNVANQDPKLLSQITIALETTQACALFDKQLVVCKALKFADSLVKEYKKQAGRTESVEKKLLKEQEKTAVSKEKLADLKTKRAEDKKDFTLKTKIQKTTETLVRNQVRLLQWYTQLILDDLQTNRYDVYKNSSIPTVRELYSALSNELKSNKTIHTRDGIDIATQDIETAYKLHERGVVPLQETEIDKLYLETADITEKTIDEFLKNLILKTQQQPP